MQNNRRGGAWREGAQAKPRGGYRFITVAQLTMGWWALTEGLIQLRDLRVWFACHEALERRCTMERGRKPLFTVAEIQRMTGGVGGVRHTSASLRRLTQVGLVTWNPGKVSIATSPEQLRGVELGGYWEFLNSIPNRRRKVPVPRQILRLIAGGARRGVIATLLGHMLRGLFYRSGQCAPNGAVAASWIADTFSVGEATVKHARAHLVGLGILEPLETPQLVMNRIGRWFRFNLDWERPAAVTEASKAVDNLDGPLTESTPPRAESDTASTPPEVNRNLLSGDRNQKPGCARPAGSFSSKEGNVAKPNIKHVTQTDLDDTGRLLDLFDQAVRVKLVDGGQHDRLRFVGAAEHARTIGSVNPPGLFAWIVRKKRWSYITDGDEDAANKRLKRHLYGETSVRAKEWSRPKPTNPFDELSEDARFAQVVQRVLPQRGLRGDPFSYLRRERPEWTRDRWDAACDELIRARAQQAQRLAEPEDISMLTIAGVPQ